MMFFVFQVSRKLRVGVPIEEHAEFVYTRAMFEKFYDELFESGRYFIESVHEDGSYCVALLRRPIDEVEKKFLRNVEYSLLVVMSELSTVRCNRVLGLWLSVHGRRVSTESCRGGAVADGPCGGRR